MKRKLCVVGLTVLLVFAGVLGVAAGTSQQVVLSTFGESLMLAAQQEPAAWELPTLRAGEALQTPGTLTLANQTDTAHTLTLDHVEFPFEDRAAMAYLDHLHITVSEDAHVLYDGAYSRINDADGLIYSCDLQPGESAQLTVALRCDYTFDGETTGFEDGTVIDWNFYTVVETAVAAGDKPAAAFGDPALREVLIAAGAAVVLLGGVAVYEVIRRQKR